MVKKIYIIWGFGYFEINRHEMSIIENDFLSWKLKNSVYGYAFTKYFIDKFWKDNVINCLVRWKWEYKNILWYKGYWKNHWWLIKELRINRKESFVMFHWMYPWVLLYSLLPAKHKAWWRHAIIWPYDKSESKTKWIAFYLIQKFFQKFMNTIFYVNKTEEIELDSYLYHGNKYFLPIPINTEFWNIDEKIIQQDKKEKQITISCTGSICKRKNQKIILDAVKKINKIKPDLQLFVNFIWPELDHYWSEIREFIKNNQMSHIYFKWKITAQEIKDIYTKTDIYIQPSFAEWLCQTYIEAWLSWCPLILSNIPTFIDTVKDFALFFDPRDSDDLVNKILEMISTIHTYRDKNLRLKKYLENWGYKSFEKQLNYFIHHLL